MKGRIIFQKWIYRTDLVKNRDKLYVFGDNMQAVGLGGQAGEMRGEPNAVGVPTKWSPSMRDDAFFQDSDLYMVKKTIDHEFLRLRDHIAAGGDVVFPADGLGTGLSQLPVRAPRILAHIEELVSHLQYFSEN
jgi:hypothetical protein